MHIGEQTLDADATWSVVVFKFGNPEPHDYGFRSKVDKSIVGTDCFPTLRPLRGISEGLRGAAVVRANPASNLA